MSGCACAGIAIECPSDSGNDLHPGTGVGHDSLSNPGAGSDHDCHKTGSGGDDVMSKARSANVMHCPQMLVLGFGGCACWAWVWFPFGFGVFGVGLPTGCR